MEFELIKEIRVRDNEVHVEMNPALQRRGTFVGNVFVEHFWAAYDRDIRLQEIPNEILTIPFLLNVAPVLWMSGDRYVVDSMDAKLAVSLARLREIFARMYPSIGWEGEVCAKKEKETARTCVGGRVGLLYSGGVDSICSSYRHMDKSQVLITVWGCEIDPDDHVGWETTASRGRAFADAHEMDFQCVKSNHRRFLDFRALTSAYSEIGEWWRDVQHATGLSGLAGPVLFARGCARLLIASTYTEDFTGNLGSGPELDSSIFCSAFHVEHDGYEWSRQRKMDFLMHHPEARAPGAGMPTFKVCYSNKRKDGSANCCSCEKCFRTIAGIVVAGGDPTWFGFEMEMAKKLREMRYQFKHHKVRVITWLDSLFWNEIKQGVTEERLRGESLSPEVRAFLLWLQSFDFERYRAEFDARYARKIARASRFKQTALFRALKRCPSAYQLVRKWWKAWQ